MLQVDAPDDRSLGDCPAVRFGGPSGEEAPATRSVERWTSKPADSTWLLSNGVGRIVLRTAAIAAAVGLWQFLVVFEVVPSAAVATPSSIVVALRPMLSTGQFWASLADTLLSWGISLGVSLGIAIPAGLALGASDVAYRMSRVTIDFVRSVPPVAIIPLAVLLYGATPEMAFMVIIFGSLWPIMLQTMYGVHQIDPVVRDVVRSYKIGRIHRTLFVVAPSAAPFTVTGVRIAATMSLLLAVGAELVGGAPGIGASIAASQENGDMPRMYSFIVVTATLGVVLNLTMAFVERRGLKWHSAHRFASRG